MEIYPLCKYDLDLLKIVKTKSQDKATRQKDRWTKGNSYR